ncbi:MAG TPA: PilZ domain-containing protein [Terriglobales bacterium]|nr:PilZ domain-containing protein [Terriglobales bacterium]
MASPAVRHSPKLAPRVALVQLDGITGDTLTRAFVQCGVQTILVGEDFAQRLAREQFQGCILRLDDQASAVLEAVRSSRSNKKMILYGVVSHHLEVRPHAKYGINAIVELPLDRSMALQVARSTCALLLNELRRYVRIPIVVEVTIESRSGKSVGSSREISGGGMSVSFTEQIRDASGQISLSFTLPEKPTVKIAATTCWQNGAELGFQFQDSDAGRQIVKDWINSFLGLQ